MINRSALGLLDAFTASCCLTISSIGVSVYIEQSHTELLVFIIGGYLISISLTLKIMFTFITENIFTIELLVQYLTSLFHLISGILLIIKIIINQFDVHKGVQHWDIIIPVIFFIDLIGMVISLCLSTINYFEFLSTNKNDVEQQNWAMQEEDDSSIKGGNFHTGMHNKIEVSKKISGQTLVDETEKAAYQREKFLSDALKDNEMHTPIEDSENSDYAVYTSSNWMQSGNILNTMKFPSTIEELSSDGEKPRGSFSLFGSPKTESPKKLRFYNHNFSKSSISKSQDLTPNIKYDLKYSRSVPEILKNSSISTARLYDEKFNTSCKKIITTNTLNDNSIASTHESGLEKNITSNLSSSNSIKTIHDKSSAGRRISLINSICETDNNTPAYEEEEEEENPQTEIKETEDNNGFEKHVQRSKSTGQINSKRQKQRQQRWKSIHDERTFLSNVNELLLPSVLKTGESPIMKIRRKQQHFLESNLDTRSTDQSQDTCRSNFTDQLYEQAPTAIFNEGSLCNLKKQEQNAINTILDESDNDSFRFKHASKFSEPINQSEFEGFDQRSFVQYNEKNLKSHRSNKGIYNFDVEYPAKPNIQEQSQEEYEKSLVGLENIPRSNSYNMNWNDKVSEREFSRSSIKVISLKEWDDSLENWNEYRSRQGVNLNVPGITRLVSDQNLKHFDKENQKDENLMNVDYLLPPVEDRTDNIDNLSDINSVRGTDDAASKLIRPSYSLSNRSFSAPSLHTFRKARDISGGSSSEGYSIESPPSIPSYEMSFYNVNELKRCKTPLQNSSQSYSNSSSPFKKFLQESPKRISSVFRRKSLSRYSNDSNSLKGGYGIHKHTFSAVSNQYSLNSAISSRSSSPKKSLRSLINRPLNRNSVPSFSLPDLNSKIVSNKLHTNNVSAIPNRNALLYRGDDDHDLWNLDHTPSSDKSRVSSVPSAVIGEYDREKWRILQTLQDQGKVSLPIS